MTMCAIQERQFKPVKLKAIQKGKEAAPWRYLMVWERRGREGTEVRTCNAQVTALTR